MSKPLQVVLALALLGAAAYLFLRQGGGSDSAEDFPDGVWWICGSCRHEFAMDRDEVARLYQADPDAPVSCPECGEGRTMRAVKCPLEACAKVYPDTIQRKLIGGKVCCPVCEQPLP